MPSALAPEQPVPSTRLPGKAPAGPATQPARPRGREGVRESMAGAAATEFAQASASSALWADAVGTAPAREGLDAALAAAPATADVVEQPVPTQPPALAEQAPTTEQVVPAGPAASATQAERPALSAGRASASALLLPGEEPPPTYRTRLPPALTLRYQVRSGFLRGSGELRWRPQGERYSLGLEADLAGLTLLRQSSEGEIDGHGLAPARFVDQRARRSRQAANFRRDAGTITFSGPATEWPLLPGSQDRLSFFIQLAAIAAAEPELRSEGARIQMVVAGARGDAAVWTFRCLGPEAIETGVGPVQALKFVRDARSMYDTRAEVWLDPARHYLPAHATLRNSAGTSEYDLLLDGIATP